MSEHHLRTCEVAPRVSNSAEIMRQFSAEEFHVCGGSINSGHFHNPNAVFCPAFSFRLSRILGVLFFLLQARHARRRAKKSVGAANPPTTPGPVVRSSLINTTMKPHAN